MQVTSVSLTRFATARNLADLRHYFEYSNHGVEVVADGLPEVTFGEYLVEQGVIDRYQLFLSLQMQDRRPELQVGEAAASLGFASAGAIAHLHMRYQALVTVDVD